MLSDGAGVATLGELDRWGSLCFTGESNEPPMLFREPPCIFDFDGSEEVSPLNQQASQLTFSAPTSDPAPPSLPLGLDALHALRGAAARCDLQGHSWTDLEVATPAGSCVLSVHVTQSSVPGHYLMVAADRDSLAEDRLTQETAAAIAHHVRNPMAGIRGAVEVIGSQLAPDNQGLRTIVRHIVERIDDLDRSLDSMLTFLRPQQPQLRSVDLRALLEQVLAAELRPDSIQALSVRLSCDDAKSVADSGQLTQALLAMLTNAAEAVQEAAGSVDITLTKEPPFATISVTSGGTGIPTEACSRVFEPFFTTKPRALGLGLTNARKIARAHGGDLVVRSSETSTQVQLKLPLQASAPRGSD